MFYICSNLRALGKGAVTAEIIVQIHVIILNHLFLYILQLCSLNNQDPRQKVDVEDDDDDHRDSKEPVAVTLIHPTMKVLKR